MIEFKAGMESVDFGMINNMLASFSQGSYYQAKMRRDEAKMQKYCEGLLRKLRTIPRTNDYFEGVDRYLGTLEWSRDLSRTFIHLDMDAFYAYVEELDDPEIRGKPVAVGSMDMLVTSNYVARTYGIRSGIPGVLALRICPELIIKPQRLDRYRQVSGIIRAQMRLFDENFVSPSLDEGCVDITNALKDNPSLKPIDIAKLLQSKIFQNTGLTCSMGIAPSPLLAKLCSETNKPNGYFALERDIKKCKEYIASIPVKKIPGIGKTRQRLLEMLGLNTIEDVLESKYELYYILPEGHRDLLFKHALAVPVFPQPSQYFLLKKRSMISKEKSCKEIYDDNDLEDLLENLYLDAITMLYNEQKIAHGLVIKVQDFKHRVVNHTFSLNDKVPPPQVDMEGFIIYPKKENGEEEDQEEEEEEKPKKSIEEQSISYQDNCLAIREHFFSIAKSVRFDQIRSIGLRLVNLVEL